MGHMSSTRKLLLIVGLACLIPIFAFAIRFSPGLYRSIFSPYLEQEVAGPVTITQEWQEITPPKALRADRQLQYVILTIGGPFEPNNKGGWGLRLPDGSVVIPEVQLVDQGGPIVDLKSVTWDKTGMGFGAENLPKDRVYRAVRIRANKPIKVSRVYWRCWNTWDVS